MQVIFTEKELEDFLCEGKNLKKYLGLDFVARQVYIPPAGIIDILAYCKTSNCFVIIELKRGLLDCSALCQGLSYLKYYKEIRGYNPINKKKMRNFCVLLVGQSLSADLYKLINSGEFNYYCPNEVHYRLFRVKFEIEFKFNFFSETQRHYQQKLCDVADRFEDAARDFLESKTSELF